MISKALIHTPAALRHLAHSLRLGIARLARKHESRFEGKGAGGQVTLSHIGARRMPAERAVDMLTEGDVKQQLGDYPNLHPFLSYITRIANLYVTAGVEESNVQWCCLANAKWKAKAPTIAAYVDAFIEECEELEEKVKHVRGQVMPIPVPVPVVPPAVVPKAPVDLRIKYQHDIAQLRRLRTQQTLQHGKRLAQAALALENCFHWVSSGAKEPGFYGHYGVDYLPKTFWTKTRTDNANDDGVHEPKRNDFAAWLVAKGQVPSRESFMNCWEAVLFSAFQANLVDKVWLQMIHRKAGLAYEVGHRVGGQTAQAAAAHYNEALSQAFNYYSSVKFEPLAGLIPKQGDILFWDRDNHVGISLGHKWVGVERRDLAMSLWHHNNKRFAKVTLAEMPKWMSNTLRFLPCPF